MQTRARAPRLSGTDYDALAAGTLTFAVGETSKTIDISVIGDAAVEPDETVVVTLSNAVNAVLSCDDWHRDDHQRRPGAHRSDGSRARAGSGYGADLHRGG